MIACCKCSGKAEYAYYQPREHELALYCSDCDGPCTSETVVLDIKDRPDNAKTMLAMVSSIHRRDATILALNARETLRESSLRWATTGYMISGLCSVSLLIALLAVVFGEPR